MAEEIVEENSTAGNGVEFVNPHTGEIVDNDAIEIGSLYEKARLSIIDSVRYQIECGAKLTAKKESLRHGEWLPWLAANASVLGFTSRRTATMLMRAAAEAANGKLASHLDERQAAQISRQIWGHADGQLIQQSNSNEHYTPAEYIEAAREVLGDIDLDPASCDEANETIKALRIFTEDDDGLSKDWRGRVWLNPPYGELVGPFVTKLTAEYAAGNVKAAIVLVNAHCTDTQWFQSLWDGTLCFTHHRINFYGDETRSGSTHGSVFVYFGHDHGLFVDRFSEFGAIVRRATA